MNTDEALEVIEAKAKEIAENLGYAVTKKFGVATLALGTELAVLWSTTTDEEVLICADEVLTVGYGYTIDTLTADLTDGWQEIQKFIKEIRR